MNKKSCSPWKKIVAVGCTHGHLCNTQIQDQVLSFCERWKPDYRIHLGDFLDLAAFRSGAKGTNDEAANVAHDLKAGFEFLQSFRPTTLFMGNHEDRLWTFQSSPNAVKSQLATYVIGDLYKLCKDMKCRLVEHYSVVDNRTWEDIGNARFMHGHMFNEMASRDHAEAFAPLHGYLVHAHTHRPAWEHGRRHDSPIGICVGTLTDIPAMTYAKNRRATLAWGHGLVYGETNGKETKLWLNDAGTGTFRFPV